MRIKLIFLFLFASTAATSQVIITNPVTDSSIYNPVNYIQAANQPQTSNGVHTIVYTNIINPAYQMHKLYMDNTNTKQLAKQFYLNGKLHGPFESYQMDKLLAKGKYKEGKLDGERITYWGNGTTIMEKATYTDGKRSGVWEYYNLQGVIKRRVTYNNNGAISMDEQF